MLSESARAASLEEARYRVPYPNSLPRAVKVIALDKPSADLLDELAAQTWRGARFFTATHAQSENGDLKTWLADLAGHAMDLASEIAQADFVVVVATAGEDARSASVIAELCALHHKSLVALITPRRDDSDAAVIDSLKQLRPFARMLVVTHGRDYVETMLTALRA